MQHEQVLDRFERWRRLGWMRPLEARFVEFLADLAPQEDARVLLAAGLTSHALSQGHVFVDIGELVEGPGRLLALPPPEFTRHADTVDQSEWAAAEAAIGSELEAMAADDWLGALRASRLVGAGEGGEPLVLDGSRLFLRRNWAATEEIARELSARSQPLDTGLPDDAIRVLIDDLFTGPDAGEGPDWQKIACAVAARYPFSIITGGPGTGKTWTMVKLLGLLQAINEQRSGGEPRPLRILLAAPTGKAAARMTESLRGNWQHLPERYQGDTFRPEEARTLHRLLGSRPDSRHFRHHRDNPVAADVVIVDEASMIDLQMMQALCRAVSPRTRLILLGDKDQLASVEPGAVFGDLCRGSGEAEYGEELVAWLERVSGEQLAATDGPSGIHNQRVMLQTARRFNQDIADLAEAVNAGRASEASRLLDERAPVLERLTPGNESDPALRALLVETGHERYFETLGEPGERSAEDEDGIRQCLGAYGQFQVLAATRSGPWGIDGLNATIRRWLAESGRVPASGSWFHGRPVMVTRNDYATGLMNGDVGLCLALAQPDGTTGLRVVFQRADGQLHHYATTRVPDCQTAWAMTVHKSQGSEFTHTVLALPERHNRVLTRELVYTGLTRARQRFTLVAPSPEVFTRAVEQRTQRSSALADRLVEP